jgi:hypothetical protein
MKVKFGAMRIRKDPPIAVLFFEREITKIERQSVKPTRKH